MCDPPEVLSSERKCEDVTNLVELMMRMIHLNFYNRPFQYSANPRLSHDFFNVYVYFAFKIFFISSLFLLKV